MEEVQMIVMMLGAFMALLIVVGLTYKPDGKGESEWEKVAARLGLRFFDRGLPDLEIQGELEGYELQVTMREAWVETGKSEMLERFTIASIRLREEEWKRGASLMMEKERSALSMEAEKWLGGYFFSAPPSSKVRRTLENGEVRRVLMELGKNASSVQLLNGELKVEESWFISDAGALEALMGKVKRAAEILDEGIASSSGLENPERASLSGGRKSQKEKAVEEDAYVVDGAADW